jgi:hypothetical protein
VIIGPLSSARASLLERCGMSVPRHFSAVWGKGLKRRPSPHAPSRFAILAIELVQNIGLVTIDLPKPGSNRLKPGLESFHATITTR